MPPNSTKSLASIIPNPIPKNHNQISQPINRITKLHYQIIHPPTKLNS